MQRSHPALVLLFAVTACSLESGALLPPDGAGGTADGAVTDSGAPDAVMDADAARDSSSSDGRVDGSVADGSLDTGSADTGTPDTGPADTGPADTGPADTGPADTGPTCVVADEACNGRDDDCDGAVDETGCSGCRRSTHSGSIYLACDTNIGWTSARSTCMSMGYDLVIIDDASENEHVRLQSVPFGRDFWIGMDDRMANATYRWVDGRIVRQAGVDMLFTVWQPGEPDDDITMNCIEMDSAAGDWNDVPCGELKPIICETHPATVTVSP